MLLRVDGDVGRSVHFRVSRPVKLDHESNAVMMGTIVIAGGLGSMWYSSR